MLIKMELNMPIWKLRVMVMSIYCPWWDCFTTTDDDTDTKEAMYQAVYAMDENELHEHL